MAVIFNRHTQEVRLVTQYKIHLAHDCEILEVRFSNKNNNNRVPGFTLSFFSCAAVEQVWYIIQLNGGVGFPKADDLLINIVRLSFADSPNM